MAKIHPSAIVEKGAHLDENVVVGPNCVIESGASIGAGTILDSNVVIAKSVKIGRDNLFYPGCVIGRGPQILGYGLDSKVGELVIGDRNVFRECVTIHLSRYTDAITQIGSDNLMMVGAHIGHDCTVEDKIVVSNCVHIGGHCRIETGAWLAGMAAAHQFVTIGKWCFVAGLAGLIRDVPPFLIVSGHYPPKIRGVNKRGLLRAGLNEQQQECINEAYKKLYRQGGALLKNAKTLAQEDGLDPNVRAIVESIEKSSQHRFGRYLETLRRIS
jgi:UDP-N-acetylglucosamine acyltransferase